MLYKYLFHKAAMKEGAEDDDVLISEDDPADIWALDEVLGQGGVGKVRNNSYRFKNLVHTDPPMQVWKAHKKASPDTGEPQQHQPTI